MQTLQGSESSLSDFSPTTQAFLEESVILSRAVT